MPYCSKFVKFGSKIEKSKKKWPTSGMWVLTAFLFTGAVNAKCDIVSLYDQFNSENISQNEIEQWLSQFDLEDQGTAVLLLE